MTTKTRHPCAGRSKAATDAFEAIATCQERTAHPRTIAALLEAGLIELAGWEVLGRDAFGTIKVPVYQVPLSVHMQWCEWCSENV